MWIDVVLLVIDLQFYFILLHIFLLCREQIIIKKHKFIVIIMDLWKLCGRFIGLFSHIPVEQILENIEINLSIRTSDNGVFIKKKLMRRGTYTIP